MNGMAMMLKSMGIDPEQITEAMNGFQKMLASFNEKLDRIERQQAALLEMISKLESDGVLLRSIHSVTHEGVNGHG
jgi:DNA invertase Pin-like site-specific DNA recombinase